MIDLHAPQRQPGESQADYRQRRAASKAYTASLRCAGQGGGTSSRKQLRDSQRANGRLVGVYGQGLLQAQRRRNQQRQQAQGGPRDEHGAFTLTGALACFVDIDPGPRWCKTAGYTTPRGFGSEARRMWLAGISAQRGY